MLHIPLYYIVWSNLCYMGCSWWWCMSSSASCILLTLLLITNQIFLTLSIYLIFPFQIKKHEFVWLKTLWCKTLHNLVLFLYIFPFGFCLDAEKFEFWNPGFLYMDSLLTITQLKWLATLSYSRIVSTFVSMFLLWKFYTDEDVSSKGLLPSKRIFLHLCVLWERS